MFKVGDRMLNVSEDRGPNFGKKGTIIEVSSGYARVRYDDGITGSAISPEEHYKLLSSKKSIMSNLIEKFSLAFTSEPEKSFIKAGITNSNGNGLLTEDGQKVLLSWLLKKNGNEFKAEVVDPILADKDAQ